VGKCPSHRVALRLVVQSVSLVLVFGTARTRVHTVFRLEVLWERFCVDRLDIASDCVFHLDAVSRILKRNPLYSVIVLSHHKRSGCGNRTWSSIWIHTRTSWWAAVWRSLWSLLSWTHLWALSLHLCLRHLLPGAIGKLRRHRMRRVLKRLRWRRLRHESRVNWATLRLAWLRIWMLDSIRSILIHRLLVRVKWSPIWIVLR
jgi:hypothetical protein